MNTSTSEAGIAMGQIRYLNTTKPTIHVAFAFDNGYLTPFYVVLTSLFKNNKDNHIHLHVIATGLSSQDKAEVEQYVLANEGDITYYEIDEDQLKGLVILKDSHLQVAAYYRLFFPELVSPSIEKLLYLDTDLIVNGDLAELYATPLDNFPVGVVVEWSATKTRPDLGIYERDQYFNSGVLLMNLKEWREQHITQRAIQFVHLNPEKVKYADQDALNVVLFKNYYRLEGKYNRIHSDVPVNLTREGYREFLRDSVVVHYTNVENKPWYFLSRSKVRFVYHEYRKLAPKGIGPAYFGLMPAHFPPGILIKSRLRELLGRTRPLLAMFHLLQGRKPKLPTGYKKKQSAITTDFNASHTTVKEMIEKVS